MSRRFINQLGENESIHEVFLVGNKQLRQNRNGNLYLQMRLTDRTGSVTGMMWNANDHIAGAFDNGDYVEVEGKSQFYNGSMQIIVNRVDRAEHGKIDEDDFIQVSREVTEALAKELSSMLRGIETLYLRNLAECFLSDDIFMQKFLRAPAAVKNHHAYHGGLLEHVVSLMKVVQAVTPFYPDLDADLLLIGAFVHDIGKIDELTYERDLAYSDEGQLIGHLVMGISMLESKLAEVDQLADEPFPDDAAILLKHFIVSHHGKLEFGSPKVPMTREAVVLNLLDDLDAKMNNLSQIMREDVSVDSRWTAYQTHLNRKLFKGDTE